MHLASINALAFLVNTREGVDKTQRNTIISGFTLRSVFVKAITGVRYSPLYIYYELLIGLRLMCRHNLENNRLIILQA